MIFNRDGKPLERNFIRRIFKRFLGKAGLREIRIHDIRHTYAGLPLSDRVTRLRQGTTGSFQYPDDGRHLRETYSEQ